MIFSILKTLALGIWLGSLIMLGYAVAGPIFQQSPSKTLAGAINGVILGRMNSIEWVCALIALASSVVLLVLNWSGEARTLRISEVAIICVSVVLLWFYSNHITGRMETLRQTIGDFDHPKQTREYVEAKADFDVLHHRYTKLVGINMVLILGGFVLSMVNAAPLKWAALGGKTGGLLDYRRPAHRFPIRGRASQHDHEHQNGDCRNGNQQPGIGVGWDLRAGCGSRGGGCGVLNGTAR